MQLHPLAVGFADAAEAYERGRPEYAPAVVGALAAELGLPPGARVLDLAAGTGKLTRALLAAGLDVVAVEPQGELRARLAEHVGAERVRAGVAEAIPLPDASVAAVTVADAFHWFDRAAALAEIRRVLRPGGALAVLWCMRDWSGAPWADQLGRLMSDLRPAHPGVDGPPWQESVRAAPGWGPPRDVRVTVSQPTSVEQLVAYVASISWIGALPAERRAEVLARAERIVRVETPRDLPVHVSIGLVSPT